MLHNDREESMTVRTLTFLQSATLAVVVGSALACASTGEQNAMLREAEFGPTTEIVDPDGNFRSALSLPFTVESDPDGDLTLEIPLAGSELPVYCFIANHETELGVAALRVTQAIFDALRENFEISSLRIAAIDSGAIEDVAYQSISMSFLIQSDSESGVGLMKTASANKHGRAITCNHWDAGFIETFERVFSELVRNFQVSDPPPAPSYTEISRVRVGELPVSVVTLSFTRDADGDIQAVSESSTLIPTTENEFQASYSREIDWARNGGELINSFSFESDVDGEKTSLALKWDDDRGWHVQGLYENKEIANELGHRDPLDSAVSEWRALRHQLIPQGDESRVNLERWIPTADPTRAIELSIAANPEDARLATLAAGPLEMQLQRGQDGLPESAVVSFGSVSMTIEVIFRNGEL
jgi:hypothetical protein